MVNASGCGQENAAKDRPTVEGDGQIHDLSAAALSILANSPCS